MPRVSGTNTGDTDAVLGSFEPSGKLRPDTAAKDPAAFHSQALAGDDEHDSQAASRRLGEEDRHCPFGGSQGHAMEIKCRFGAASSPCQGAIDVAIEPIQRLRHRLERTDRRHALFGAGCDVLGRRTGIGAGGGGPWARDNWGYNPYAQWFANRGYACLQVNCRGSTGYGKKFLNAGNRDEIVITRNSTEAINLVAATWGQKRARSAIPPETIAGTAAAKVARKKNLTRS